MKLRTDSSLSQLTPDQLNTLFDWISESCEDAIRKAAAPPPDGFGIKLHRTTLARFYSAERARRNFESISQDTLSETQPIDPESLLLHAKRQLAHASFQISQEPLTPSLYNNLSRACYRLDLLLQKKRSLEIAERQIDVSQARDAERKRQWEFNASRQVMKYFLQLSEIHRTPNQDDEQKIWRARELLFGPASNLQSAIPTSPLPMGPHVANATDHNGQQTCGGLGKSLGGLGPGEGPGSSNLKSEVPNPQSAADALPTS